VRVSPIDDKMKPATATAELEVMDQGTPAIMPSELDKTATSFDAAASNSEVRGPLGWARWDATPFHVGSGAQGSLCLRAV
jgi:hypothetical protein